MPARLRLFLALALVACLGVPAAAAAAATKIVRYHGYRLSVPAGWPVYRLQRNRTTCVRFDRHAVYLGEPSADQRCPAVAAGRTEAILVSPLGSAPARAAAVAGHLLPVARRGAAAGPGSEAQLVNSAHRVLVTATWNRRPAAIQRALGVRSLAAAAATAARTRPPSAVQTDARSSSSARARTAAVASRPGQVYTGAGFDACSTPSTSAMTAWGASPYRAIGVYIGGTNMACSQPNLTASWVNQQALSGWHLIPIYVGLQAPGNSCGCAAISASNATAQGVAAAQDAITDAQAIGLGTGNPLYFDMEGYDRGGTTTAAVLAFLSAWTTQLHASGYASGVYSSEASGIRDLVAEAGTGYLEPDDIWIANWNGSASTADPVVPAQDWSSHQRLHQYSGGHNETYQGATINIDGDYIDAATAAAGTASGYSAPAPAPAPSLSVSPRSDGSVALTPSWRGATGVVAWQLLAGPSPVALTSTVASVAAGARMPIVTDNAFPYFAVRAVGALGQTLGSSAPVPLPASTALFGKSAFVPHRGLAGIPTGCFNTAPCQLSTTVTAGATRVAATGSERVAQAGGLAFFKLSPTGQALLAHAPGHRLPVTVKLRSTAGRTVSRALTLTSFATTGATPARVASQSPVLKFVGTRDYVSHGWVGGLLAGCFAATPCPTTTKIVAGGKTIARTRPQVLGVNELGYLFFALTPAGHTLLAQAHGNQLPATATITSGTVTARAHVVLTSY